MVASALAGGDEHVAVRQLAEPLVRSDDDGVVAVELAKRMAAGLAAAVEHWSSPP